MQNTLRAMLRAALKIMFRGVIGRARSVAFQRRWILLVSSTTRVARGTRSVADEWNGVRGVRVHPVKHSDDARVLLYLHGGGFTLGSHRTHKSITSHIARASTAPVVVPNYRLAPEHPYPAALDDTLSVYRKLLEHSLPSDIAIGGDSAGAGLALQAVLAMPDAGLPTPAALLLISPWVDLSLSGDSHQQMRDVDPMLADSWLRRAADAYRGDIPAHDPRVSSLFADLRGLPPTLVQVGRDEILLSDAQRLTERALAAGVDLRLEVETGLWHDYQLHAGLLRASDAAIDRIGEFLQVKWNVASSR